MSQGFICCSFVRDRHILLLCWSYSKPGEVGLISRMFIKSKSDMSACAIFFGLLGIMPVLFLNA